MFSKQNCEKEELKKFRGNFYEMLHDTTFLKTEHFEKLRIKL